MRKPLIAGNWKMHKTRDEALQFIYAVANDLPSRQYVDTVICPQAPVLRDLVKRQGEQLRIGAQTMHEATEGAYTGEVSAALLENIGVDYVIIGHSERREHFAETDDAVNRKLHQAFRYDLTPILCIGEKLEEREGNRTEDVVAKQLDIALKGLGKDQVERLVIAYEPIWAIGTGKTATVEQAEETIAFIRRRVKETYDEAVSEQVRILYGGSVNPENLPAMLKTANIDGALIGGASLNAKDFLTMADAALKR